jgi:hypothetical protein
MAVSWRRPTVYLDFLKATTKVVCQFRHPCGSAPFDQRSEDIDRQRWLWDVSGQLMVISIPFHNGCHWVKYLGEFIPIVEQLKELHAAGYVHGDMRCTNLVFPDETLKRPGIEEKADLFHLIDFDLGGKINDSPPIQFPKGYETVVFDGRRDGARGEITKWHDWVALMQIIFLCHEIQLPEDLPSSFGVQFVHIRSIFRLNQSDPDMARDVDSLLAFLREFHDWEVRLDQFYKSALESRGLYKSESGSPNKTASN